MKKIYLSFLFLIIFFSGCSINDATNLKESTLSSYEKPNMIDSLTKEDQEKIINALELSIPNNIELSVRFITFCELKDDIHFSYYKIELDGIEDYEEFWTANKDQIHSGKFAIAGYAENIYKIGGKQYYLSIMVATSDVENKKENKKYFETIKNIYEEIKNSIN